MSVRERSERREQPEVRSEGNEVTEAKEQNEGGSETTDAALIEQSEIRGEKGEGKARTLNRF